MRYIGPLAATNSVDELHYFNFNHDSTRSPPRIPLTGTVELSSGVVHFSQCLLVDLLRRQLTNTIGIRVYIFNNKRGLCIPDSECLNMIPDILVDLQCKKLVSCEGQLQLSRNDVAKLHKRDTQVIHNIIIVRIDIQFHDNKAVNFNLRNNFTSINGDDRESPMCENNTPVHILTVWERPDFTWHEKIAGQQTEEHT